MTNSIKRGARVRYTGDIWPDDPPGLDGAEGVVTKLSRIGLQNVATVKFDGLLSLMVCLEDNLELVEES